MSIFLELVVNFNESLFFKNQKTVLHNGLLYSIIQVCSFIWWARVTLSFFLQKNFRTYVKFSGIGGPILSN